MKEKPTVIAQRLMNLYRNAHVIQGSWRAVNAVFLDESDDAVLDEIRKLPAGEKLAEHILELRAGKIDRASISLELMPYGGMMEVRFDEVAADTKFSSEDLDSLERELENFQPTAEHLKKIESLPFVRQFGDRWLAGVRAAISARPNLVARWQTVYSASRAFDLWERAANILSWTPTERTRAEVQADLPEYETYLPMFGIAGQELLTRLRAFVASM
jgi:hypothetical protein